MQAVRREVLAAHERRIAGLARALLSQVQGFKGKNPLSSRAMVLYGEHEWVTDTSCIAVSAVGVSWELLCVREGNACSLLMNR
jgi:hypothetical protein